MYSKTSGSRVEHVPSTDSHFRSRGTSFLFAKAAALLAAAAFPFATSWAADLGETIWKAGDEFVTLAAQDSLPLAQTPAPNHHPVELKPAELAAALSKIELQRDRRPVALLDTATARRIAEPLSAALRHASPRQDVLFAAEQWVKAAVIGSNPVIVAGRIFYVDGRLHVIIGDLHVSALAPEFYRTVAGPMTIDRRLHPHQPGERARERQYAGARFAPGNGVTLLAQNGTTRGDWLVVDLTASSQAGGSGRTDDAHGSPLPVEPRSPKPSATSVEERLMQLRELHDKALITDDEYARKRKEILDEL